MYNIKQFQNNEEYSTLFAKSYKKKLKSFLLLLLAYAVLMAITLPFDLYSQNSAGGYSGAFLSRQVGARASAMGGAYTAVSNEPYAIFYNPAGLGDLPNIPLITTSYSMLSYGRSHQSIAWGQAISENVSMGIGINSVLSQEFQGRNVQGLATNTLQDHEYSFNLGFAYSLEYVSMGGTIKFLKQNLMGEDIYSDAVALDLGTKLNIMDMFTVGATIQNLGSIVLGKKGKNFYDVNELIPFVIKTGIAMEFGLNDEFYSTRSSVTGELETIHLPATQYILVSLDAVMNQFEETPYVLFGTEAIVHKMLAVRGGISIYGSDEGKAKFFPMNYWGAGFSLRPEIEDLGFKFHIDYSVAKEYLSSQNISHNFSIVLEF